jgi:two-component sensor histidine kinase
MERSRHQSSRPHGSPAQDRLTVVESERENAPAASSTCDPQSLFPDPELLCRMLEAGQTGIWWWEAGSDQIVWSTEGGESRTGSERARDTTATTSPSHIHPEDRPAVRAAIEAALRGREPRRVQYRVSSRPPAEDRCLETVVAAWSEDGRPLKLLGSSREITDHAGVARELRIRSGQQAALARLAERAIAGNELQILFDDAVATVAQTLDVDLVKILELVPGDAELQLKAGIGWRPGLVGAALVSSSGRDTPAGLALAAGAPVIVEHFAADTRFDGEPLLHEHGAVGGLTVPIAGRDGHPYGVLGAYGTSRRRFADYDVAFLIAVANVLAGTIQRSQLDQRQELMIRELRHRSGNLFAQLLALFSQTAKSSRNVAELVPKFEARVMALANAHRLITEGGWKSASLAEIMQTLLAASRDRVSLSGHDLMLEPDPTFGLSMALHELATNARQHGSLSARAGRVELSWRVERTDQGLALMLDWKERNGPPPKRRRRAGFGAKLIDTVIERQLNGAVTRSFAADGLAASLRIPLARERWLKPGARSPVEAPGS